MEYMAVLAEIAEANNGIVDTKAAVERGIAREILRRLCFAGKIRRIERGQYVLEGEGDRLFALSRRSKQIVFSHETALYLHGVLDEPPAHPTVTALNNYLPSAAFREVCKVYCVKEELFGLGRVKVATPAGNPVPAYDLERTVCDMARSRNKLGNAAFLDAIKRYAASPGKDLERLSAYAEKMHMANILRPYLEVLL